MEGDDKRVRDQLAAEVDLTALAGLDEGGWAQLTRSLVSAWTSGEDSEAGRALAREEAGVVAATLAAAGPRASVLDLLRGAAGCGLAYEALGGLRQGGGERRD